MEQPAAGFAGGDGEDRVILGSSKRVEAARATPGRAAGEGSAVGVAEGGESCPLVGLDEGVDPVGVVGGEAGQWPRAARRSRR